MEQATIDRGPGACPVCRGETEAIVADPGWHVCRECSLEFVYPLALPESPEGLFSGAYEGHRGESGMEDFAIRMARRAVLVKNPRLWFWTPAFDLTLQWLNRHAPGGTVMELGCGLGFVLHAMRREGFEAVGLDVAEPAVRANRRDGFRVWHGTLERLPDGWVDADAIVAFFMLHHLVDPVGFVSGIRKRWPHALLAIAQYGPSNRDPVRSQPPRTLTRWNVQSLQTLLRRAGYECEVTGLTGRASEPWVLRLVRRALRPTLAMPALYRLLKAADSRLINPALRGSEIDDFVILAFSRPLNTAFGY